MIADTCETGQQPVTPDDELFAGAEAATQYESSVSVMDPPQPTSVPILPIRTIGELIDEHPTLRPPVIHGLPSRSTPLGFDVVNEAERIAQYLRHRSQLWPEEDRPELAKAVRKFAGELMSGED